MVGIIYSLLKEATLSILGKVAWKAIFERFYTRLVIYGLNKIKDMSSNDVVDETVDDIINSLKGKRLKVIEDARETPK